MFLIDIPFKGYQGRSNRTSIVHAVSMTPHAHVHVVSMTPHATCTVHAVSLTPHVYLIFLHTIAVLHMIFSFRSCSKIFCACGVNDTAGILKNSNIFENSNLYSEKPRTDVLMKKTEGRKSRDTVPLKQHFTNAVALRNWGL
jgi:hypothetical protein